MRLKRSAATIVASLNGTPLPELSENSADVIRILQSELRKEGWRFNFPRDEVLSLLLRVGVDHTQLDKRCIAEYKQIAIDSHFKRERSRNGFSSWFTNENDIDDFDVVMTDEAIKSFLKRELEGESEVKTLHGRIDLLTPKVIMEIKRSYNVKDALGQILFYSYDLPHHRKVIVMLHAGDDEKRPSAAKICASVGVELWEVFGGSEYTFQRVDTEERQEISMTAIEAFG